MKFDIKHNWRKIARVAAGVTGMMIPGAVAVEAGVEGAVDAFKDPAAKNEAKAKAVVDAALAGLQAEGEIVGKQYATPRVQSAVRRLNDANVELLNALAEAHAAPPTEVIGG